MEKQDPKETVQKVMQVLRGFFEPKGVKVPAPVQVLTFPASNKLKNLLHVGLQSSAGSTKALHEPVVWWKHQGQT